MTVAEPIAAGLVGAVLLWLVAQPMVAPARTRHEPLDLPEPEETPRGQALLALKEIEFDHATGKLSDADFAALNARYSAAAIEMLDPSVAPPAQTPAVLGSAVHCLLHGACAESEARFCPECGCGLVTTTGNCAACGFAASPDSMFCAGCGVPLRS